MELYGNLPSTLVPECTVWLLQSSQVLTMPFLIVGARASGTFLGLSQIPKLPVTVCILSLQCGGNFYLVKFWKNQVIFTVRLAQRQSFVVFVTAGVRFFSVWRRIDLLTAVATLPLSNSSVQTSSFHKAFSINECCCLLTGLDPYNLQWRSNFSSIDTLSGKHRRKRTTCKFLNQVPKLHPPCRPSFDPFIRPTYF